MSNPLPQPEPACLRKKRYSTEEQAKAVAVECWYRRKESLRVYACSSCGGFHLTKMDAAPMMKAGWRLPKTSERQRAHKRKQDRRRR